MCGIAGYSLTESSALDPTFAAQALLAGIAERGADAVGYAHRVPGGRVAIHKQRSGASALLEQVAIPGGASDVLVAGETEGVGDGVALVPFVGMIDEEVEHGASRGIVDRLVEAGGDVEVDGSEGLH